MAKTYIKSNYYWRDPFVTESWWEEGYSKSLAHLRRGVKKKKHVFKNHPVFVACTNFQKSPLCWSDPWSLAGSRVCFIDCLLQQEEIMEVNTIPNYKTSPPSSRFQGKKRSGPLLEPQSITESSSSAKRSARYKISPSHHFSCEPPLQNS